MHTSSAVPSALFRYADVSRSLSEQLLCEARRLDAALGRFAATCAEYRTGVDGSLAERLVEHSRQAGAAGRRVGQVGEAFLGADTRAGAGGACIDAVGVQPAPARASSAAQDAACWLTGAEARATGARARAATTAARLSTPRLVAWLGAIGVVVAVEAAGLPSLAVVGAWGAADAAANWVADGVVDLGRALAAAFQEAAGWLVAGFGFVLSVAGAASAAAGRATAWVMRATATAVAGTAAFVWETLERIRWNWVSLRLVALLGGVELAHRLAGGAGVAGALALVVASPPLAGVVALLFGDVLFALGGASLLELIGMAPGGPAELLDLMHQNFWDLAFQNADPRLLRALAAQIEELHARLLPDEARLRSEAAGDFEPPGAGGLPAVSADEVFGPGVPGPGGLVALDPGVVQRGGHALISAYAGEQVSMAQVGAGEYVVGVNGLDLVNMGGSPNGLVAVIDTAYFDPGRNAYYQEVKVRCLDYLRSVPPGSALNFTGHSMGAGMLMLLLNDPAFQAELRRRGCRVGSVTTYGMVRPADRRRNDVPPDEPAAGADAALFGGTVVQHYVDPDDRLAMNVGGGHTGRERVTFVDDGQVADPVAAHTSYQDKDYGRDRLPFQVDPERFRLFPRSGCLAPAHP
jgi:hypothetical protein